MLGPKGPNVAAEGCSPPQEIEKAAHRAAIFLVLVKYLNISSLTLSKKFAVSC